MANVITAGNSSNGGTAITTDTSGTLNIVTGSGSGSNAITIDASQNVAVNGNMSFNSGYGSAATAYGCRAWVNFNGTGTVAIRASGNVTSITDTGVGDYLVNFTTAMPDTNYIALIGGVYNRFVATNNDAGSFTHTTTQMRCTMNDAVGLADSAYMQITVFR